MNRGLSRKTTTTGFITTFQWHWQSQGAGGGEEKERRKWTNNIVCDT